MRQKEVAEVLGYEPSYLSALERSQKGPPRQEFIQRLIRGLKLDQREQKVLSEALDASRRQFSIPVCASEAEYQLINQLAPQLGRLLPIQIQLIHLAVLAAPTPEKESKSTLSTSYEEGHTM